MHIHGGASPLKRLDDYCDLYYSWYSSVFPFLDSILRVGHFRLHVHFFHANINCHPLIYYTVGVIKK
jgi:hypothetical protein